MTHIEVDQSGKVEDLRQDTFIAFSNEEQNCIKIPKKLKQELFFELRSKIRQFKFRIFAIGLFYSLKHVLNQKELIIICDEYPGRSAEIKTYLIPLIRKENDKFDKNIIKFAIIGKNSGAHRVAIEANRNRQKPNKILTKEEIIKYLSFRVRVRPPFLCLKRVLVLAKQGY